jgi:glycosyltransferase involved in cell wall biosynthesis
MSLAVDDGKVPVSFLVPVKNEEINLRRSLDSIRWAGEIFVVDSKSTDRTLQVAESCGAKVVQFEFNGTWPKKKNWALENLPFTYEWVFILDADEVLPKEAEAEIRGIVNVAGDSAITGYWINRRFFFMDKWLKHSYYPNWNLRLFKHKLGRYEQITVGDTQSGDNEVHEHAVVRGQTAHMKAEMDHYAFPSVDVFIEKHNRYSNWEARVAVDNMLSGTQSELQHGTVGMKRKLKQLSKCLPFRPLLRFLYVYLWQGGFLDGIEGYYFARLHGFYEFLSIAKTYELKKQLKASGNSRAK